MMVRFCLLTSTCRGSGKRWGSVYRVGGGVSGRKGVPGHELLHQGEEQLETLT